MAQENLRQQATIDGGFLPNPQQSIFAHIQIGLLKNPHQPAVICIHQDANHLADLVGVDEEFLLTRTGHHPQTTCLILTYTQLHRGALKLVAGLLANGVRPGLTALCMIPNGGEYALLLWACALLRLTLAAVDPSVIKEKIGLQNYLESVNPALVIILDADGARAVDSAVAERSDLSQPLLRVLITSDDVPSSSEWKSFQHLLGTETSSANSSYDEATLIEDAQRHDPKRIHSIHFTSGTSAGSPKGCPLRVGSMAHILESQSWLITSENSERVLQQAHNARAIAPYHTLQTWRTGGTIVMPTGPSFAIEHTVDAIQNHHVTFIVLSPAMVHALAQALPSMAGARDSVRTIQVGGDAVTKEVLMKCAALFPLARVCINHGMSEGGGVFTWPLFDRPIGRIPYFGEICPVGAVARGARIRIWDSDHISTALYRHPGQLHICCESLIRRYLGNVEVSAFYHDSDGARWMNTGDIAMVTEGGLVYILGRSKDAIKRGGISIMPAALESCIEKYTDAQVSFYQFLTTCTSQRGLHAHHPPPSTSLREPTTMSFRLIIFP
jgi:acyl-CoA synthetase (AMP-forming)/AMP-acid ligase II